MKFVLDRFAIVLALLLIAAAPTDKAWGSVADPVVIEFGEMQITRADVLQRFEMAVRILARQQGIVLADQDPSTIAQLRDQYLDKYATELVLLREAEHRQLDVASAQVDRALSNLFASEADENAFLADSSLDHNAHCLLRDIVRDEQTIRLLNEVMIKEIRVPPGDVITVHHDVKDSLATPEEVCVRHIQADSYDAAKAIRSELEKGADFAELAEARSTDAASVKNGGDLGCFERSQSAVRSAFEKAAFAAAEGELTGPVESRFGHHVMVVYQHKMPRAPTLNEAYVQIERDLALEELPRRIQALVKDSGIRVNASNYSVAKD